jgi:hypothetical protein
MQNTFYKAIVIIKNLKCLKQTHREICRLEKAQNKMQYIEEFNISQGTSLI